jgi:FKBP-type peptidyl-prolyl cis-trans isomerase 2
VVITDISDEAVTLDGNHPLAGQTLYFQVELLEIANPS